MNLFKKLSMITIIFALPLRPSQKNGTFQFGARRAFTEHIEKLAELVSEKTNGEFTMNVSYGGLSK